MKHRKTLDGAVRVRVPAELVTWLDRSARCKGPYVNRSDVVRDILLEAYARRHAAKRNAEVAT
jgi:Arc/MetJ-type ribon-helix-helix transcriptional regulator